MQTFPLEVYKPAGYCQGEGFCLKAMLYLSIAVFFFHSFCQSTSHMLVSLNIILVYSMVYVMYCMCVSFLVFDFLFPHGLYRVAVLDKVTDFLLFLGKLLIVGIVGESSSS